jgi:serine/threonine-protein kinase
MNSASAFLIRVLTVPPAQGADMMYSYQAYLERQAGHIITLRHPYMLPLISYGIHQGLPYFVWPYSSMRSLTTRLTQSGVLDVVTAGRYIDQIATVLEYAHQQTTFHRNLSLDCIYLQMDGQIVVADFGVRRLYELLTPGSQSGFFYGSLEALAPEQLTGGQIGAYTDVYALGAVTYRLLTGHTVFSGDNFRALAEQHLHASPPSLAQARGGLPVALDRVLAGALAKDPAQRIQHPGAFADAYHQIIAPANTRRVPFDSPGGPLGASSSAQSGPSGPTGQLGQSALHNGATATALQSRPATSIAYAPTEITTPSAHGMRQFIARSWWFFLIIVVLVPVISAGAFFLANNHQTAATTPSGTLQFVDSVSPPNGSTDGIHLTASNLAPPPSGSQYQAWLINQQTEQITALGKLVATSGQQAYQLAYSAPAVSGKPATNIFAQGDMVEITEERSNVVAPSGHVVLLVKFPPQAFIHIGHLLLSFPTTPGKIGLLVGTLQQTKALNTQAIALNKASGAGQTALVQCLAQSIVDIAEGSHGTRYQPLSQECRAQGVTEAGDGFGLIMPVPGQTSQSDPYSAEGGSGYIKNAADHASLATATPDATEALREHASKVQTALADVTRSVTTADTAAVTLLTTPTDSAAIAGLLSATGTAYQGTGGAGGAVAAFQQGQLMATLALAPGTP